MEVSINGGTPIAGWFIMENLNKLDDSMEFKGNFTCLSPMFNGEIHGFRLRFSLKPIQ